MSTGLTFTEFVLTRLIFIFFKYLKKWKAYPLSKTMENDIELVETLVNAIRDWSQRLRVPLRRAYEWLSTERILGQRVSRHLDMAWMAIVRADAQLAGQVDTKEVYDVP